MAGYVMSMIRVVFILTCFLKVFAKYGCDNRS